MAKDDQKSTGKEKRSSIIDAVSDWIKLLALIVLVAEAVILVAMWQTPHESSIYPAYPFIMLFLLLIVIAAVIYDRTQERKSSILSVNVGDKALAVDAAKTRAISAGVDKNSYANSLLGYSIDLPKGGEWAAPKEITYLQFVNSVMIQSDIEEEKLRLYIKGTSPYGKMLLNANILEVQNGQPASIGFDNESTTNAAEHQLEEWVKISKVQGYEPTEEEIDAKRRMLLELDGEGEIAFAVRLNIMTFNKQDMEFDYMAKGLPNLFLSMAMGSKEPIDSLTAKDDTILWVARTTLNNVLVDGKRHSTFLIYRLYQLFDDTDKIFMNMAQWSPQLDSSLNTWESLQNSFKSFKIKK